MRTPRRRIERVALLSIAAVLAACQDTPTSPALEPQFLIGSSPLQPITLIQSGILPELMVPITVNKGSVQVSTRDNFIIRLSGRFKLPTGGTLPFGPRDTEVIGQNDALLRTGASVELQPCVDIPAPVWNAIRNLDRIDVEVVVELVVVSASGREKVTDVAVLAGSIAPSGR